MRVPNNVSRDVLTGENGGASVPPSFSTLELTEEQFRAFLRTLANQSGSISKLARRLDVTSQFINQIIAGRKHPGPKLLDKLGAQMDRVYTITIEAETNGHEPKS